MKQLLLSSLLMMVGLTLTAAPSVPDFNEIPAGQKRVDAFIDYVRPQIKSVNQSVCHRRAQIIGIMLKLKNKQPITKEEEKQFKALGKQYRLTVSGPSQANAAALLARVNTAPTSMVLAQAAVESGWGTSRFAREANNYFGQHCFEAGCGLKAKHSSSEVEIFDSIDASIHAYYHMLNTRTVFKPFRQERFKQIRQDQPDLQALLQTLEPYSAIGHKYSDILFSIIEKYQLTQYDKPFYCDDSLKKAE